MRRILIVLAAGAAMPPLNYTADADPIACENLFGAGIELPLAREYSTQRLRDSRSMG